MHKILLTIAAIGLLLVFGMQNSDHVGVSFVVGGPVRVRLVFLLLIAAACGFLAAYIQGLAREIRLKKQIRRLLGERRVAPSRTLGLPIEDGDDE